MSLQHTYLNVVAYFLRKKGFNSGGGGSYGSVPTPLEYMLVYHGFKLNTKTVKAKISVNFKFQ